MYTLQLFVSNCHQLRHVDVSGCPLLTDHALLPLDDTVVPLPIGHFTEKIGQNLELDWPVA